MASPSYIPALAETHQADSDTPPSAWTVCAPGELTSLLAGGGWTLVEFWAPDCLFSRLLLPVRQRMQRAANGHLRLLCCRLDSVTSGAAEFGAPALPALVLFNGPTRIRSWLGAIDASLLRHQVDRALADAAS